ncbi:MAG: hypothetical protein R3D25_02875 [Geminicoccaceae bacterium]
MSALAVEQVAEAVADEAAAAARLGRRARAMAEGHISPPFGISRR